MRLPTALAGREIPSPGLILVFIGLALMRFVPAPEPGTFVFALGAIAVTIRHYRCRSTAAASTSHTALQLEWLAYGLLAMLLVSVILGLAAGHPLPAIVKSAIPFVAFIWALLILVPEIASARQAQTLLVLAASLWATRLIMAGALDYLSGTSLKWLRLTLVDADAVVPFPLLVIPLLLFSPMPMHRVLRAMALLLQLVIVAWAGYRSQQLLVAAMLVLALLRLIVRRPWLGLAAIVGMVLAAGVASLAIGGSSDATLLTAQLDRYTSLTEEKEASGRALERRFAIDRFLEYPVLGAGLGVQIPASITYASTEISDDYDLPETVSYLHNGSMFLLMSGGLPLLVAYLSLWLAAFANAGSLWLRVALLALFAFIHVEATFLQVHFNVLLAILMARRFGARHGQDSNRPFLPTVHPGGMQA